MIEVTNLSGNHYRGKFANFAVHIPPGKTAMITDAAAKYLFAWRSPSWTKAVCARNHWECAEELGKFRLRAMHLSPKIRGQWRAV